MMPFTFSKVHLPELNETLMNLIAIKYSKYFFVKVHG